MNIWDFMMNIINSVSNVWTWLSSPLNYNNISQNINSSFNNLMSGNVTPLILIGTSGITLAIIIKLVKALI